MTTRTIADLPRTGDTTRVLPSPSDGLAWTGEVFADIAQVPPCASPAELVETYGTADPVLLRQWFALPDDIAAAERFAVGEQVAA